MIIMGCRQNQGITWKVEVFYQYTKGGNDFSSGCIGGGHLFSGKLKIHSSIIGAFIIYYA